MNKKQYIQKLINDAQEGIWKNEMAMLYAKRFETEINIKAAEHAIERDKQYIEFLNEKLANTDN